MKLSMAPFPDVRNLSLLIFHSVSSNVLVNVFRRQLINIMVNRTYYERRLPCNLTFMSMVSNRRIRGTTLTSSASLESHWFAGRSVEGPGITVFCITAGLSPARWGVIKRPLLASIVVGVKAPMAVADRLCPVNGETLEPMVQVLLRDWPSLMRAPSSTWVVLVIEDALKGVFNIIGVILLAKLLAALLRATLSGASYSFVRLEECDLIGTGKQGRLTKTIRWEPIHYSTDPSLMLPMARPQP